MVVAMTTRITPIAMTSRTEPAASAPATLRRPQGGVHLQPPVSTGRGGSAPITPFDGHGRAIDHGHFTARPPNLRWSSPHPLHLDRHDLSNRAGGFSPGDPTPNEGRRTSTASGFNRTGRVRADYPLRWPWPNHRPWSFHRRVIESQKIRVQAAESQEVRHLPPTH